MYKPAIGESAQQYAIKKIKELLFYHSGVFKNRKGSIRKI